MKVKCACGKLIGHKVFRQHGRKCTAQLVKWMVGNGNRHGTGMYTLDERRSRPDGCTCSRLTFDGDYEAICATCVASVT